MSPVFRLLGYFVVLWMSDMHNMQEEKKGKEILGLWLKIAENCS